LLAPFLPAEALKKGITETQIGIIFGIFELVLLVLSPIFGKYVRQYDDTLAINSFRKCAIV
jgi:hypothetical protein